MYIPFPECTLQNIILKVYTYAEYILYNIYVIYIPGAQDIYSRVCVCVCVCV
jgi:hypothetical protein